MPSFCSILHTFCLPILITHLCVCVHKSVCTYLFVSRDHGLVLILGHSFSKGLLWNTWIYAKTLSFTVQLIWNAQFQMQKHFSFPKQKGMDVLYFVPRELKRETLGLPQSILQNESRIESKFSGFSIFVVNVLQSSIFLTINIQPPVL